MQIISDACPIGVVNPYKWCLSGSINGSSGRIGNSDKVCRYRTAECVLLIAAYRNICIFSCMGIGSDLLHSSVTGYIDSSLRIQSVRSAVTASTSRIGPKRTARNPNSTIGNTSSSYPIIMCCIGG
ncbi:hypothetical protein D3C86_1210670 [compost metagenome]